MCLDLSPVLPFTRSMIRESYLTLFPQFPHLPLSCFKHKYIDTHKALRLGHRYHMLPINVLHYNYLEMFMFAVICDLTKNKIIKVFCTHNEYRKILISCLSSLYFHLSLFLTWRCWVYISLKILPSSQMVSMIFSNLTHGYLTGK